MRAAVDQAVEAPGNSLPITAVALDNRIDWASFGPAKEWHEKRSYPYGRSYTLGADTSLFLFSLGAVVYEGAGQIPEQLRAAIEGCTKRRFLPATEETYFIAVDPQAKQGAARVGWDRVVIPERRPELVAAVALLLAQSVALERYEITADSLLDQTMLLSRDLAQRARLPHGTRELAERLGRLTGDRLELARWFFLVDRPAETWEDSGVAQLYDVLFANLELRQRHDAMLHKLGAVERATQSALDMWHGRRSNALEWAIVVLIVVEIVFGVWGLL
ncbi:MAG: putative Rmd1/YagE family protein [Planctomycetota bacterium]|jgi:uncharacterized Rmd1/YagE family protein